MRLAEWIEHDQYKPKWQTVEVMPFTEVTIYTYCKRICELSARPYKGYQFDLEYSNRRSLGQWVRSLKSDYTLWDESDSGLVMHRWAWIEHRLWDAYQSSARHATAGDV